MLIIRLHQHDLANFLSCPAKYNLSHNLKLENKIIKKAINIGDLFAKGVELIHFSNNKLADAMLLVNKQQEKLLNSAISQEQINDINTDTSSVQAMLYGYEKQFLRDDKYKIQPEHKIEWVLKKFGVMIVYICRLDGRLLDKNNIPGILEIKTSAKVQKDLLLELPTNFQINSYWLSNYRANKEQAKYVLYRFVCKPTIRQTQKENAEQFQKRVIGEYEKNTQKYFFQERLEFDINSIKRFEVDINLAFEDLIMCHIKNKWPHRGTACMEKYGSLCPYIRYCGNPTEETLDTYYIKGE